MKEGAYVFITGRRQAELDKAVAEIGSNVTAVQADVANPDDLGRLYKEVATKKGKLDVLFANAGIAEPKPTAAVRAEDYDKTLDINARGVFFAVQKAFSGKLSKWARCEVWKMVVLYTFGIQNRRFLNLPCRLDLCYFVNCGYTKTR